jgi:hypothetical protein
MANAVAILLGNGDGTFQVPIAYAAGPYPSWVAVGDFNRDGKPDLAVANEDPEAPSVSILLGDGDGAFQPPVAYAAGGYPVCVVAGDFNGDGNPDLAVSSYNGSGTAILLGNGDGTFRPGATYAHVTGIDLVVGDFNGDGKLDLAAGGLDLLLGNGDGTFQPQGVLAIRYAGAEFLTVADFNGDGKLDLEMTSGGLGIIWVLTNITP